MEEAVVMPADWQYSSALLDLEPTYYYGVALSV
jgi:hypothetical protein